MSVLTTARSVARALFGPRRKPGSSATASGTRWGTVGAYDGETGLATVTLDGSDDAVIIVVDYPVAAGDRIAVAAQSNSYLTPITGSTVDAISESASADAAQAAAEAAVAEVSGRIASVKEELEGEVDQRISGFMEDADFVTAAEFEQGTESIRAGVTGAAEKADAAMAKASQVEQTAEGVSTTVGRYFTDTGVTAAFESAVEQTADGIVAEAREEIESAAGQTYIAKSGTYTTPQSIVSAAKEQAVSAIDGRNYATQSYVDQQSDSITSTVESDIDGRYIARTSTYQTAASIVTTVEGDVDDEYGYLKTVVTTDSTGVTVGKSSGTAKAKVNSSGAFQVLNANNKVLAELAAASLKLNSADGYTLAQISTKSLKLNDGAGDAMMEILADSTVHVYGKAPMNPAVALGIATTDILIAGGSGGTTSVTKRVTATEFGTVVGYVSILKEATNGNATLTLAASNFQFLDIFYYGGTSRYDCVRVYTGKSSTSKTVALSCSYKSSTTTYVETTIYTLSGTSLKPLATANEGRVKLTASSTTFDHSTNYIYVTAVLGWG